MIGMKVHDQATNYRIKLGVTWKSKAPLARASVVVIVGNHNQLSLDIKFYL